jgi:CubicO group peptidase (beta-lactamase class C family)
MQSYVDQNQVAGGVALIVRQGQVAYLKAFGMADKEAGKRMTPDHIFRIASMSKAITSVAVMVLYEEGHFLLSDPISKYIPEFKDMQVLVTNDKGASEPYTLVPATREITIRLPIKKEESKS